MKKNIYKIMRYIRKFNESASIKDFDEHTDADIRDIFCDYSDEDNLEIKNMLVYNGTVVPETAYMKDASKYRKAKVVTLNMGDLDGVSLPGMEKCIISFDRVKDAIGEIERLYELGDWKDVNFRIGMDWKGLTITFVIIGGLAKQDESLADKIDGYLATMKELLVKIGHKRGTIKGNWLDMRFAKKADYSWLIHRLLQKIGSGEINLQNTTDTDSTSDVKRDMIKVRNEAWEDGLKFEISGGDQQVVLKLSKRQ